MTAAPLGAMTPTELESAVKAGKLKISHTSSARGYESRKGRGSVHPYKGRFGVGYVHFTPRWDTTRYVHATYYVLP